jgi:hypothetical protein
MTLKEQLMADMKTAMKAKDEGKLALSVIRMVRSSVRNAEINEKRDLTDEDVTAILAKEMKMRKDSLTEFQKANREDLVSQTQKEMDILKEYLPKQLNEDDLYKIVSQIIGEQDRSTLKMGDVMKSVMPKVKGRIDGSLVSKVVKKVLTAE